MNRRVKKAASASSAFVHMRLGFVILGVMALFVVLLLRVLALQGFDWYKHEGLLDRQGDVRTIRTEAIPANRGMVTDRHGVPLAVSTPVASIWMNPRHVDMTDTNLNKVAALLGYTSRDFKAKIIANKQRYFVYLRRHMAPPDADAVMALKVAGIYQQQESKRYYPAGEVTASLLGYTDIDGKGQEGVEFIYEQWLQGAPGKRQVVKDLYQRTIKLLRRIKEPTQGKDIALSIDLRVQYMAYRALKKAVSYHQAKSGSIVMLDVTTGEILAMASQPSFNPNNRTRIDINAVRNRAVTDLFEPGSTIKPITMVSALKSGQYSSDTVIDTSPGYIEVGGKVLLDPVNYGLMSMTKILAKSSQVGTTKIALALDQEHIKETFLQFGLGQFITTGYPGESPGYLPYDSHWSPLEQSTYSFGHGMSVNTLQLANVYSVLANDGIKRSVSLLKRTDAPESERMIESRYVTPVNAMMAQVTSIKGTGKKAQTDAYSVAGKTGTSNIVGDKGYDANRYIALFAGFAPAKKPRIAAAIVIKDPKGDQYYGGEVASPVFSEVVSSALRILDVVPDLLVEKSKTLGNS